MIEVLKFFFDSLPHFLGLIIVLVIITGMVGEFRPLQR